MPNVFLSYAEPDSKVARNLAGALQSQGFHAWHESQMLPGDNWAAAIDSHLQASDAMVVLLSPAWASTQKCRAELQYALGEARFAGRLIPVLLKETKDYPWILEQFPMIRYQDPSRTSLAIASSLQAGVGRPTLLLTR